MDVGPRLIREVVDLAQALCINKYNNECVSFTLKTTLRMVSVEKCISKNFSPALCGDISSAPWRRFRMNHHEYEL